MIQAQPNAFYAALRHEDPVHFDPKLNMYLVSRYDDIVTVLRDPLTYSDKHGYAAQYASGYFEEFKRILETKGGGYFPDVIKDDPPAHTRSEEHTSELQSLMRISYAVFCLKQKKQKTTRQQKIKVKNIH